MLPSMWSLALTNANAFWPALAVEGSQRNNPKRGTTIVRAVWLPVKCASMNLCMRVISPAPVSRVSDNDRNRSGRTRSSGCADTFNTNTLNNARSHFVLLESPVDSRRLLHGVLHHRRRYSGGSLPVPTLVRTGDAPTEQRDAVVRFERG